MSTENIYLIYKHVNKFNGKVYVGQTCQKPECRWAKGNGYESYYIDKEGNKKPSHFWNAIQKYGWNNFEHKILIHGLTKEQADRWEKKLIKEWNLMNPDFGYNLKEGGSHGKLSYETRKHLSEINKGKKHSEETKLKVSLAHRGSNNHFYGKKHSEETKQKMRKIWQQRIDNGYIHPNKGKKMFNMSGEKHPLFGKHPTEQTREKMRENHYNVSGSNNPRARKVISLFDNKIYYCIKDCSQYTNISRNTITKHCKHKIQNPQFMYYEEYLSLNEEVNIDE